MAETREATAGDGYATFGLSRAFGQVQRKVSKGSPLLRPAWHGKNSHGKSRAGTRETDALCNFVIYRTFFLKKYFVLHSTDRGRCMHGFSIPNRVWSSPLTVENRRASCTESSFLAPDEAQAQRSLAVWSLIRVV